MWVYSSCMRTDYEPMFEDILLKWMHSIILADNRQKPQFVKRPGFLLKEYGNNEMTAVPLHLTWVKGDSLFFDVQIISDWTLNTASVYQQWLFSDNDSFQQNIRHRVKRFYIIGTVKPSRQARSSDMGLIVQNVIVKWEIPSLIKLTALKSGTVEYLVLIKVEWVVPKVSCLSHEGERSRLEGLKENQRQPNPSLGYDGRTGSLMLK